MVSSCSDKTLHVGGSRPTNSGPGIFFQVEALKDIELRQLTGFYAGAGTVAVHFRSGLLGESPGIGWKQVASFEVTHAGSATSPQLNFCFTRGTYTLFIRCSGGLRYTNTKTGVETARDQCLVIHSGIGCICSRTPDPQHFHSYDRQFPRSWDGSFQYRCHDAFKIAHLDRLTSVIHSDCKFADAEILCGSLRLPVHRIILASASPVFEKMLTAGMLEACSGRIVLEDAHPEVVTAVVRFIYCGTVPDDFLVECVEFAHKYDIIGLIDASSRRLLSSITPGNVAAALRTLRLHWKSHQQEREHSVECSMCQLYLDMKQQVLDDAALVNALIDDL